jgi:hypothetical protein
MATETSAINPTMSKGKILAIPKEFNPVIDVAALNRSSHMGYVVL